ncbi:hypothetical protein [uncultured Amnibacterium sp.]|uniref:hypothetical protein n=1 Tax=uncultured Amnibacterium sp. TaxID=1631851 RepID=UPI0035CAFD19
MDAAAETVMAPEAVAALEGVVPVEAADGTAAVLSAADVAVSSAVANDVARDDEAAVDATVLDRVCRTPSIDWMACIWFTTSA